MSRKQLKVNTHALSTLAIVLIVIVVAASVVGAVVVWWLLVGSVNLVTEEMEFSDFMSVEAGWGFEVEITQSSSYSVEITADEYVEVSRTGEDEYERELTFDYIQVSKVGDTLVIGLKSDYNYRSVHPLRPLTLRAEITMLDLYELKLSGGSQGTAKGFTSSHEFAVDLSGGSRFSGDYTTSGDAQFILSGGSHLIGLDGAANDLTINGSGGSHLDLSDFPVYDAAVNLSGGSGATVNLDGRLDGDLSGGSHLKYIGNPTTVDVNTSGGSTVGPQ